MSETFLHPEHGIPVKLGRTVARRNEASRRRALSMHFFLSLLPEAPLEFDNTHGIKDWGMMLNDDLGDCTIATPGHLIQGWTAAAGKMVTVPDSAIEAAYCKWDGYVVGNPSTDQGGDILTVLQDWQDQTLDGNQITAHAEVNMTQLRWQQALYLFRGIDCGVQLPFAAQKQVGHTWDITENGQGVGAPGTWGGHCMAAEAYDPDGVTFITWGRKQRATWRWVMYYCDEAHAILSPQCPVRPEISTEALAADLRTIGT